MLSYDRIDVSEGIDMNKRVYYLSLMIFIRCRVYVSTTCLQ